MVDRFGRVATDLWVSLIDKCNLRCTYCMPTEGLPWLKRAELLDTEEMVRLIRIAVETLGVTNVRFTGVSRCRATTSLTSCPRPRSSPAVLGRR